MPDFSFDINDAIMIALMVCALLISIIGHEIMHGLVAFYYGDTSAKDAGRLSINPIKHIDLVALSYFRAFCSSRKRCFCLAGRNRCR